MIFNVTAYVTFDIVKLRLVIYYEKMREIIVGEDSDFTKSKDDFSSLESETNGSVEVTPSSIFKRTQSAHTSSRENL